MFEYNGREFLIVDYNRFDYTGNNLIKVLD